MAGEPRLQIFFNQNDEIERVELDGEQLEFQEVDDLPGIAPPAPGVAVIAWNEDNISRCVVHDGEVSPPAGPAHRWQVPFEELDPTARPAEATSPSKPQPPVQSISLDAMQQQDEVGRATGLAPAPVQKELVNAFELLATDGGVDWHGFRIIVSFYFQAAGHELRDELGSEVRNWFDSKVRDRIDFGSLQSFIQSHAPAREVLPAKLLLARLRERDPNGRGLVTGAALAEQLSLVGLSGSEQADLMAKTATQGENGLVDYAGFARGCSRLTADKTVKKLGWLLARAATDSVLRFTMAAAVMPRCARASMLATRLTAGHNLPSSAVYPRLDSNCTPLANLGLTRERLLVSQPGRALQLTLDHAVGIPFPDSSFTVLSRQAQICLATDRLVLGPVHTASASLGENGGHWLFPELPAHNPVLARLPELGMPVKRSESSDPLKKLMLLIELSVTVRRRHVETSDTSSVGLKRGPTLASDLMKRNSTVGYRTRFVTWDWGKGLSVFEDSDAAAAGVLKSFVPIGEVTSAATSQWRDASFAINTSARRWEFAAENPQDAEHWLKTIQADVAIQQSQARGSEARSFSLGWITIPVASTPEFGEFEYPLNAGSMISPDAYAPSDLSIKNSGIFDSGFVRPTVKLSLAPLDPQGVPARWQGTIPAMSVFSEGMVPFVGMFRQAMADKLLADTAGAHWSLLHACDDPAITWFPAIMDSVDTLEAFLSLWDKHGITPAQMRGSRDRSDLDYLLEQWRASVLQLYPALVDCPPPRAEDSLALEQRAEKLAWFVANPVIRAMGGDKLFTKPFHTSELVSDPVHALLAPTEGPAHFGDMAAADVTIFVQRLAMLLEQGMRPGASFCVFFEAALSHADLQDLGRYGYRSLEELDAAFRETPCGLNHSPEEVQALFREILQGHSKVDCIDPFNLAMAVPGFNKSSSGGGSAHPMSGASLGETLFFAASATDPRNWKLSADFFFSLSPIAA